MPNEPFIGSLTKAKIFDCGKQAWTLHELGKKRSLVAGKKSISAVELYVIFVP